MTSKKLGFVGLGIVGGAVAKAFGTLFPTVGYDIKTAPDKSTTSGDGYYFFIATNGNCEWHSRSKLFAGNLSVVVRK